MILTETANQTKAGAAITELPVIAAPGSDFINIKGVAWMGENEKLLSDVETQHCYRLRSDQVKIMAQASVLLPGEKFNAVDIRRGMIITSIEGTEVGKVAGVVISPDNGQVQYLILSHLPRETIYRCIPVSWIERMQGEVVSLNKRLEIILALPDWHAS